MCVYKYICMRARVRVCVFEIPEEKVRVCSYIDCYYIMMFLHLTSVFKATLSQQIKCYTYVLCFLHYKQYTSYVCCIIHSTLIHVNIAINNIL